MSIELTPQPGGGHLTGKTHLRVVMMYCSTDCFRPRYAYYATTGGEPIDPKVLLALLLYAYATGVFSSRQIEQATYEVIPFRFIAGGLHPDHSTLAWFRKQFLAEIKLVFAQVLLIAHELGYLTLGNISLDGSRIHADASKSQAVSFGQNLLCPSEHPRRGVWSVWPGT